MRREEYKRGKAMERQDWYELGAQIGDLVQSAIDTNNFQQLSQSIADTINAAFGQAQGAWKADTRPGETTGWTAQSASGTTWRSAGGTAYGQAKNRTRGAGQNAYAQDTDASRRKSDASFAEKSQTKRGAGQKFTHLSGSYKGLGQMIAGIVLAVNFAGLCIVFLALSRLFNLFGLGYLVCMILLAVSVVFAVRGYRTFARSKRQKRYVKLIGERTECSFQELADGTGKSVQYVKKDLRRMIQDGMFAGEVYLDEAGERLILGQKAYQEYQRSKEEQASRRQEGEKKKKESADTKQAHSAGSESQKEPFSKEEEQILKEGRDFLTHIRECNEAIGDEAMSGKLSRLEDVVAKIFRQVAANPESAPDLHKMMEYYLPITRKLVDAYLSLDAQKVEGRNITGTKREIEESLDTINTAFENLLDSFFEETAWDISSDISVLHTMMAQDGLMKKDFEAKDSKKEQKNPNENPAGQG